MLTGSGDGTHVTYNVTNGSGTITVNDVAIKSQKADNYSGLGAELPWVTAGADATPADPGTAGNKNVVFTYTSSELTGVAFAG